MTVRSVNIQFAINAEETPMAVVRDANTFELLSVWNGAEASELYRTLTRKDMRIDYHELRAVRPSEESSTEHS